MLNNIFSKKIKFGFIAVLYLILLPNLLSADVFAKVGTAGLQFLKIGPDAKGIGMGYAYTPYVKGASASFWNPAGLAFTNRSELFLSHLEYVSDIQYEYITFAIPTSLGVFALNSSILHMGWMDVIDANSFAPTGEQFTASDIMTGLSYATHLTGKFSIGLTGKYLRQNLDEFNVDGWSIDLGSQYNTGWRDLTIGMSLRNFGPDLKYTVDEDNDGKIDEDPFDLLDNDGDGLIDEDQKELSFPLPMNFSLGLSMNLFEKDMQSLNGVIQLDNCVDRQETYSLGCEYQIGTFFLRAGKLFNYDAQDYAFGLGWRVSTAFAIIDIDFAYNSMGDLEENDGNSFFQGNQRISLRMQF